jgi:predicted ester cyclase
VSVEENRALVHRMYDLLKRGEMAAYYGLLAPQYAEHLLGNDMSLKQVSRWEADFGAAFSDIGVTLDDVVAEGDKAAVLVTWKATHRGHYMGFAPTGKDIVMHNANMFRIADGKLVEVWNVMDMRFLQQLGAVPSAPPKK